MLTFRLCCLHSKHRDNKAAKMFAQICMNQPISEHFKLYITSLVRGRFIRWAFFPSSLFYDEIMFFAFNALAMKLCYAVMVLYLTYTFMHLLSEPFACFIMFIINNFFLGWYRVWWWRVFLLNVCKMLYTIFSQ